MQKDTVLKNIIVLLGSFLAAWACIRACSLNSMSIMGSIFWLMIFVLFKFSEDYCKDFISKKCTIISAVISAIFTLFYVCAEHEVLLEDLDNRLFRFIIMVVCIIGLFLLFFYCVYLILTFIGKKNFVDNVNNSLPSSFWKYFPCFSLFIIFVSWIPWFLYSYPGIMTPDSINQIEQIVGQVPYSNHHPLVHTLTIGLLFRLGMAITNTANGGVGAYIIFQMLFLASCAAFLIRTVLIYAKKYSKPIAVVILCFYAFMPYNAVMSITVWKDSFFAGIVLLLSTVLFRLLISSEYKIYDIVLYYMVSVAFCLYRSNGWYAFVLLLPILLISFWKEKKIMYPVTGLIIISAIIVKGPIMNYYGVIQPDFVESLCIPVQQVARVLVDNVTITDEEREQIEKVIDTTYIKELYAADFADNMKELVRAGNEDYLTEHKSEYAKLYLKMMREYPNEFFHAYVEQTYGYYDPVSAYKVADVEGIIPNNVDAYSEPKIASHLLLKLREILIKLQEIVPVYGSMWSIGAMMWYVILLLGISIALTKKIRPVCFVPFLPAIAIVCTLLIATPVATEFRYAYGMFYSLPLFIFISFERPFEHNI